jgi:hypothetical protein
MATIVLQMGHVARTSGFTGTWREQEFARAVAGRTVPLLTASGHDVKVIGADDAIPACDVFIALHTDGATDKKRRGCSVGYPSDDPNSSHGRLARAWLASHQLHGYPGGALRDNYTPALRSYYGFGKVNARYEFLAEHGTTTNDEDEAWLFANLDKCAQAHVDAIGAVLGHPIPALPPRPEEDDMEYRAIRRVEDGAIALVKKGHFDHVDGDKYSALIAGGLANSPADEVNAVEWDRIKAYVLKQPA